MRLTLRTFALCAALGLTISGAALAAPPQGQPAPPAVEAEPEATPQAVRAEEAQAVIDQAGAGAWFEAQGWNEPRALHRPSGLVCRLGPPGTSRITVYPPSTSGAAPGEDVSCVVMEGGTVLSLYATRYPRPTSAQEALDRAVWEIAMVYPGAQAINVPPSEIAGDSPRRPASLSAHFILPRFGSRPGPYYSRASVAVVNGWVIKMRFSAPDSENARAAAQGHWDTALASFAQAGGV